MNADGSDQRRLAATATGGHFMRWAPDGQAVILRADTPEGLQTVRVSVDSGTIERLPDIVSGAHMSFSPDRSRIMDVRSHKVLWVHPLTGGQPYQIFQFLDPNIRIDYPVWSPDGRWVLFDRAATRGGDIWLLQGIE